MDHTSLNCSCQPYIGFDAQCSLSAQFCINHSPHLNSANLFHSMLPQYQLKSTLKQIKLTMEEKTEQLSARLSEFMDCLISELKDLKIKQTTELSYLWMRELAGDEREYENMRRVFRNDFHGLTCRDLHAVYGKIIRYKQVAARDMEEIDSYRGYMKALSVDSSELISNIVNRLTLLDGVFQGGEILKKMLPEQARNQQFQKVVVESGSSECEAEGCSAVMLQDTTNYVSIFSRHLLVEARQYTLELTSQYQNVLIGITSEKHSGVDLHYEDASITFNCSNGCLYREGGFESSPVTISDQHMELNVKVERRQLLIKHQNRLVVQCRIPDKQFYLHVLLRTKGDKLSVKSDNNNTQGSIINHGIKSKIEESFQKIEVMNNTSSAQKARMPKAILTLKPQTFSDQSLTLKRGLLPIRANREVQKGIFYGSKCMLIDEEITSQFENKSKSSFKQSSGSILKQQQRKEVLQSKIRKERGMPEVKTSSDSDVFEIRIFSEERDESARMLKVTDQKGRLGLNDSKDEQLCESFVMSPSLPYSSSLQHFLKNPSLEKLKNSHLPESQTAPLTTALNTAKPSTKEDSVQSRIMIRCDSEEQSLKMVDNLRVRKV